MSRFVQVVMSSLIVGILLLPASMYAQILYPGLSGPALLQAVQNDYTPNLDLSYAEARDTLYSQIDVRNDTVYGIYTDFAVYLEPNTDPTATLFTGGINTEHIYPQGRGATDGTPAYRNMHHLAPTRVDVNQDRANNPFADIADNQTDNWYYLNQKQQSIPTNNIDLYSEATGQFFEPREDMKGNVARAVFYIHAIYRDQVNSVDPDFFNIQREDLCAWHLSDPADETEKTRTMQIANYQDGKENPFVLDCTLADRMYCENSGGCMVSTFDMEGIEDEIKIYYQSTSRELLTYNLSNRDIILNIEIFSMDGKLVLQRNEIGVSFESIHQQRIELNSGLYYILANSEEGEYFRSVFVVE